MLHNFVPILISPGEYVLQLDRMDINGIDKLYVTPSNSVRHVKLIVLGSHIAVVHPNADGEVVFWENWYVNRAQSLHIHIEIVMNDTTVPTIMYREHTAAVPYEGSCKVFINEQDRIPKPYQGTPYNNKLIWRDGVLVLKYSH